jgi:hypothetical protein
MNIFDFEGITFPLTFSVVERIMIFLKFKSSEEMTTMTRLKQITTHLEQYRPRNMDVTVQDWSLLRTHPIQRNTENHAKKMEADLQEFSEDHADVQAALFNGVLYKVNGHTRGLLWDEDRVSHPKCLLNMRVFYPKTREELDKLHKNDDKPRAVKNMADRVLGKFRDKGYTPVSYLYQKGTLANALRKVADAARRGGVEWGGKFDIDESMTYWWDAIPVVDNMVKGYDTNKVLTGIQGAMLISVRVHGRAVYGFWRAYLEQDVGLTTDPHARLIETVAQFKAAGRTSGQTDIQELASYALSCVDRYLRGEQMRSRSKANLLTYMHKDKAKPKVRSRKAVKSTDMISGVDQQVFF